MPREIKAEELKQRMDAGEDFLLVDVMPPSQYLLLHLPGAINIPLEYLHEVMEYLPRDKDVILYCTNEDCDFSRVGARKLELHGFTNVVIFHGGLAEWEQKGYIFATVLLPPVEETPEHTHTHEQPQAAEADAPEPVPAGVP